MLPRRCFGVNKGFQNSFWCLPFLIRWYGQEIGLIFLRLFNKVLLASWGQNSYKQTEIFSLAFSLLLEHFISFEYREIKVIKSAGFFVCVCVCILFSFFLNLVF